MSQTTDPISQAFSLPMDVFVGSMRGLQRIADEGLKAITGMLGPCGGTSWATERCTTGDKAMPRSDESCRPRYDDDRDDRDRRRDDRCRDDWRTERCRQDDYDDRSCEKYRLFQFTVVNVRRGGAAVLDRGEELDVDCMSRESFCQWMMARFVARNKVSDEDAKYLRVYCRELDCWTKPPLHYHEEQLEVLRGIRDGVGGKG